MIPRSVADIIAKRHLVLRACAAKGMTRAEAAAHMGLPYRTVKRMAARLGLALAPTVPDAPRGAKTAAHVARERTEGTPRRCLCGCGQPFLSLHVGERIAPKCRPSWSER